MAGVCAGVGCVATLLVPEGRGVRCRARNVVKRVQVGAGRTGWVEGLGESRDASRVVAGGSRGRERGRGDRSMEGDGGERGILVAGEDGERVTLPANVDYISSLGNSYVKYLVRLRRSAATRHSTASVLVVGTVPLREICESVEFEVKVQRGCPLIDVLLVKEGSDVPQGLAKLSDRIVRVSEGVMGKISGVEDGVQSVGVLSYPSTFCSLDRHQHLNSVTIQMHKWCPTPRRVLVLDAIQDPGNLGTLIRTAAAFAWDGVFLLQGCCDPFNDKALRAARGAGFRVPIAVGAWDQLREFASTKKLELYAGDPEPDGQKLTEESSFPQSSGRGGNSVADCRENRQGISLDFSHESGLNLIRKEGGLCLVLGSEGQGLSLEVSRDCRPIGIPMPGKFESLNVAVAGGIFMFLLRYGT